MIKIVYVFVSSTRFSLQFAAETAMIEKIEDGGHLMLDYIRIACAVPAVRVGDVKKNAEDICNYIAKADAQNVDLLVFPELVLDPELLPALPLVLLSEVHLQRHSSS